MIEFFAIIGGILLMLFLSLAQDDDEDVEGGPEP